jgi:diadenosine tetraphosphate (Ap4A) HIT family hydrolase
MWFIHSEDLATVFIGPFSTREAAQTHLETHIIPIRQGGGYNDYVVETPDEDQPFIISPERDVARWTEVEAEGYLEAIIARWENSR